MDLLPRVSSDFSSSVYWESFFKKRKASFEWYGNYLELCAILHRYMKDKDDILVAGCGNSELSEQIYNAGFQKITNIDISKAVLDQMRKKNKQKRGMKWLEMNLTKMDFPDDSFSVVLDKGTLDALMSGSSDNGNVTVEKIFQEISRVLRFGGRYICISLAQDHILNALMKFFPSNHWMIRIHKVWTDDHHSEDGGMDMPVFAFVITKFKNLPEKIFEVCLEDGIKPTRLKSEEEIVELIKTQQYYALMRRKLLQDGGTEQPLCITLYSSDNIDAPRYTMHVVDMKNHKLCNKFGVFIVPRGREREWLFSTEEGRRHVAESAQFKRIIFVSLSREHEYTGMQEVQDELSAKVLELAPSTLPRNYKAPFLSVGNNDLGQVFVRHQGQRSVTGGYVIEDYKGENGWWYRHLVVNSVVKSTVKLKEAPKTKSRKQRDRGSNDEDLHRVVDPSHFASQYTGAVITGLSSVVNSVDLKFNVLFLGLGGGAILLHLIHCFKSCHTVVVESDKEIVGVVTKWFGLDNELFTNRLDVKIESCANYLNSLICTEDKQSLHAVIDTEHLVSSDPDLLKHIGSILLDKGVFMTYVDKQHQEYCSKIRAEFPHQYLIKCAEEIGDVLVCSKSVVNLSFDEWKRKAKKLERSSKNNLGLCDYFDDVLQIT